LTRTRIHPETGKTLHRDVRPQIVVFGSFTHTVDGPGWYPDDDSDSIHSGADLAESDRVFQDLKAAYGAHVRRIGKEKLRLSQEEAGRLIGGGPRAFQKYESGATPPSDAAVRLIELLDRHPENLSFFVRSGRRLGLSDVSEPRPLRGAGRSVSARPEEPPLAAAGHPRAPARPHDQIRVTGAPGIHLAQEAAHVVCVAAGRPEGEVGVAVVAAQDAQRLRARHADSEIEDAECGPPAFAAAGLHPRFRIAHHVARRAATGENQRADRGENAPAHESAPYASPLTL
jgi:HTH-type transcriptional regulator/antitoxin MqsA